MHLSTPNLQEKDLKNYFLLHAVDTFFPLPNALNVTNV